MESLLKHQLSARTLRLETSPSHKQIRKPTRRKKKVVPRLGLEPRTNRLRVCCSTIELPRLPKGMAFIPTSHPLVNTSFGCRHVRANCHQTSARTHFDEDSGNSNMAFAARPLAPVSPSDSTTRVNFAFTTSRSSALSKNLSAASSKFSGVAALWMNSG